MQKFRILVSNSKHETKSILLENIQRCQNQFYTCQISFASFNGGTNYRLKSMKHSHLRFKVCLVSDIYQCVICHCIQSLPLFLKLSPVFTSEYHVRCVCASQYVFYRYSFWNFCFSVGLCSHYMFYDSVCGLKKRILFSFSCYCVSFYV